MLCSQEPRIAGKALHVLLVEDNPGDAVLLRLALEEAGCRNTLHVCSTMAEAAEALSDASFDVALLDLSLPDSQGLETIARLQSMAPMLPIVVMTGLTDPKVADRALECGAQDFLVKGDFPGHLVERAIRYAISRMNSELERRSLLTRLATERAVMARELDRARATQRALLPSAERLGRIQAAVGITLESHFEPSLAIGGDLWGCADLRDGGLAFYCFDFSGHGISAALNVFRLHTLIADHQDLAGQPGAMLEQLNASLVPLLERGQYATMFYGVLDRQKEEVRWAGAGAPRPLLMTEGKVRPLDSSGLPLGLRADARYPVRTCPFPSLASLLVYSDALSDAVGRDGAVLGEEGVSHILEQLLADGRPGGLERFLKHFSEVAAGPVADDLTALWMTRL